MRKKRILRDAEQSENRWQDGALTMNVFILHSECEAAYVGGGRMHSHLFPTVQAGNAA